MLYRCRVGWLGKKERFVNYGPTPSVKKYLFLRPINQAQGGWGIKYLLGALNKNKRSFKMRNGIYLLYLASQFVQECVQRPGPKDFFFLYPYLKQVGYSLRQGVPFLQQVWDSCMLLARLMKEYIASIFPCQERPLFVYCFRATIE